MGKEYSPLAAVLAALARGMPRWLYEVPAADAPLRTRMWIDCRRLVFVMTWLVAWCYLLGLLVVVGAPEIIAAFVRDSGGAVALPAWWKVRRPPAASS